MEFPITRTKAPKQKPDGKKLGFGQYFSDHMFSMDYSSDKGWHSPRIEPYGPIALDPAAMCLHYAQEIFDGHKAYRTPAGGIVLFRPASNIARLNRSAERLCIPKVDEALVLDACKQLINLEKDWVPTEPGTSLYLRPTIIATESGLAVRAAKAYRFFIVLSPVGAYFAEGFKPVKIMVTKDYVRAVRGGIGAAKAAANYAASLYAGELAHREGFSQVLWLDGVEQKYVEEVGAMNICFVIDGKLVTPALGTILPGITRESVLQMARHWNLPTEERRISIDEVIAGIDSGKVTEAFGCGTAAVIAPVGWLKYGDKTYTVSGDKVGPVAAKLYKALTDIQFGRATDPFGWMVQVVK